MIDWEQRYRENETPWDKGNAHPSLVRALSEVGVSGRVLVPGCGFGYDVAAIANHPGVTGVTGLDIAQSAVDATRRTVAALPHATAEKADLFHLPKALRGVHDWVWEHTCFCAIDPSLRNAYVNAVADALKPGGHLLAVFYLRPWDTDEENATLGPPHACSAEELDRRFATRFEVQRTWEPHATYEGREGREQLRLLRRV